MARHSTWGGYHRGCMHLKTGAERTAWTADWQRERKAKVERRLHLSRLAHETRRPGQTLQARVRELEREFA